MAKLMTMETKHQSDIIKSVRIEGGYARKISNQFQVGLPDLIISFPGLSACLCEVKKISKAIDCFNRGFDCPVTLKQRLELEKFNQINSQAGETAFILVTVEHRRENRLVILPWTADRLDYSYESDRGCWCTRQVGGIYQIEPLLIDAGAAGLKV